MKHSVSVAKGFPAWSLLCCFDPFCVDTIQNSGEFYSFVNVIQLCVVKEAYRFKLARLHSYRGTEFLQV